MDGKTSEQDLKKALEADHESEMSDHDKYMKLAENMQKEEKSYS